MTIETLQKQKADKEIELQSISQKVTAKAQELARIQSEINAAVARKSPDEAVSLTQQKRVVEDELQILQQVQKNIADAPAYTVYDLQQAWQALVNQCDSDVEELHPRLAKAFQKYQQAIDELLALRNQASQAGRTLKLIAADEHIDFSPHTNFKRKQFGEFWQRNDKFKLNCFDSFVPGSFWQDISLE